MPFTFTPTVLVIDDEPHIRRFVRAALEEEGCEVHEADRVERGLIEAGTRQPDAVILDLGLPDGDGMQLIRELRTWTEVPVLVLSARVDERDKIEAIDMGRRGIHNEGSRILMERLAGKVELDLDTARRLWGGATSARA